MTGGKDFSETKVPHGSGQLYQSVSPIIGACRKDREVDRQHQEPKHGMKQLEVKSTVGKEKI